MSFLNSTPYAALDVPLPDPNGREVVVAIVKAAFDVQRDGAVVLSERPPVIRVNDECWVENNPRSSIRFPTDVCIEKHGTDVVVVGDAISRKPVTAMDVAVRVRDVTAPLLVHGERVFYQGPLHVAIGPAAPFERKPIVYEKAYGGASDDYTLMEPRNPSGVGVARHPKDLIDHPAPQIEHPARPHKHAGDKNPPMGYGAIWSHWSPRLEHAGTFDAVWLDTRMPLMPLDHNVLANNVAHPSLIFEKPVAPGDIISVLGMTPEGLLSFEVPLFRVVLRARFDRSGSVTVRPAIDTVFIQPEEHRFELVMRKAFPVGRGEDVLREIRAELDA
jgi:hypothetical protein